MMKLVCEFLTNGQMVPKVATTVADIDLVASAIKDNRPGVGAPFLIYMTLPYPDFKLLSATWDERYVVSDDVNENKRMIEEQLANPLYENLQWKP